MGATDSGVIGQSVRRKEDVRFLTGAGQYTDDVTLPHQIVRLFPALAACAREDPQDRHRPRPRPRPGVVADLHRATT